MWPRHGALNVEF